MPKRSSSAKPRRQKRRPSGRKSTRVSVPKSIPASKPLHQGPAPRRAITLGMSKMYAPLNALNYSKHPQKNRTIADVAESMINPLDTSPLHLPILSVGVPTAVAKPIFKQKINFSGWQSGSYANSALTPGEQVVAIFRHPARALILGDPNSTAQQFQYIANWHLGDGGAGSQSYKIGVGTLPLTWSPAVAQSTYRPHGRLLFPGVASDSSNSAPRQGFWVTSGISGSVLSLLINYTTSASWTLRVRLFRFDGSEWVLLGTDGAAGIVSGTGTSYTTVLTSLMTSDGYYSVEVATESANIDLTFNYVQLNNLSTGPVMCHRAVPTYEDNYTACETIRINSAAALVSNIAPALYVNGSILSYQASSGQDWADSASFTAIGLMPNCHELVAKNGVYNALRAGTELDFQFQETGYDVSRGGIPVSLSFPIVSDTPYVMNVAQVELTSANTYAGGLFQLQYAAHVEFTTTNSWLPASLSPFPSAMAAEVLDVVRSAPAVYENPFHWSDITNFISNVANGVIKWAPKVAKVAGTAAQVAALVAPLVV